MKRLLYTILLIALVFALAACGPKQAATHLETIQKNGTIKVGTSADYPPFEYVDESGTKVGFDIDLMTEIAKRMNVKLEWVDMPFDSLIAGVKEGKIDLAISAFNYTEERDKEVDFSEPYYTSEDSFLVADGFGGQIAQPEDVAAYKVGVQTSTTQDSWLTDTLVTPGKLPEDQLFRYDRVDQAALDLKSGRIDVLMSDYVPAQALVQQLGGLKVVYHGSLSSGPMNIVLPEGDKELAAKVNEIVKAIQQEGLIDQIAQKHLSLK